MELRQMLVDPKLFKESFFYCRHYFLEHREVTNYKGEKVKVVGAKRLRYRNHKLWLEKGNAINDYVYLSNPQGAEDGDWMVTVDTPDKDTNGYTEKETERIHNFTMMEAFKGLDIKRIKKILETRGAEIKFASEAN